MAAPLDVFPPSADATPDALLAGVSGKAIEGRSLGQIAWMRLRRDKVAMGGGVVVLFLILVAIAGPHLVQNPDTFHANLINPTFLRPTGAFGGISLAHPLGVEPETGRDVLARLVVGAQYSLLIAVLVFVLGFFAWPYMGRIIRGQALSLREREFVAAARSLGARGPYILFRELLPNLVAPILVYSTLLIPVNILFEAALSYLGVGIIPPTPSWGGMLSDAVNNGYYSVDPMFMIIPGLAIFLTVLAFNLFGDGLRDALDPRSSR